MSPARPTAEEASTLVIGPGTPVLCVTLAAYDEHGVILEVSESVWPGDQVMVVDEYEIPADSQGASSESDV